MLQFSIKFYNKVFLIVSFLINFSVIKQFRETKMIHSRFEVDNKSIWPRKSKCIIFQKKKNIKLNVLCKMMDSPISWKIKAKYSNSLFFQCKCKIHHHTILLETRTHSQWIIHKINNTHEIVGLKRYLSIFEQQVNVVNWIIPWVLGWKVGIHRSKDFMSSNGIQIHIHLQPNMVLEWNRIPIPAKSHWIQSTKFNIRQWIVVFLLLQQLKDDFFWCNILVFYSHVELKLCYFISYMVLLC